MTPRPLHKWKTFWLGILVLLFLSWTWIRSMSHLDSGTLGAGTTAFHLHITGAHIVLERTSLTTPLGWIPRIQFHSETGSAFGQRWFPPAIQRADLTAEITRQLQQFEANTGQSVKSDPAFAAMLQLIEQNRGHSTWRLAHWFLILLFLIAWAVLLAWRWQRMKRLTTPPPPEPTP